MWITHSLGGVRVWERESQSQLYQYISKADTEGLLIIPHPGGALGTLGRPGPLPGPDTPTHLRTHMLKHTHLLTHLLKHTCTHSLKYTPTHNFTQTLIHSNTYFTHTSWNTRTRMLKHTFTAWLHIISIITCIRSYQSLLTNIKSQFCPQPVGSVAIISLSCFLRGLNVHGHYLPLHVMQAFPFPFGGKVF